MKKLLASSDIENPKKTLVGVVSMLVGLIKAVAPDRVYEEPAAYVSSLPSEQVKVKE